MISFKCSPYALNWTVMKVNLPGNEDGWMKVTYYLQAGEAKDTVHADYIYKHTAFHRQIKCGIPR
jgi:hypothetical protein